MTPDQMRDLAVLAKLSVTEEELDGLTRDLSQIIAFAATIHNAVAEDTRFDRNNQLPGTFRPDVVTPSLPQREILQNAPAQDNGCFLVQNKK